MKPWELPQIAYVHSETYSTTQNGHAVAAYLANVWRKEGKSVQVEETTQGISVSYTEIGSFGDIPADTIDGYIQRWEEEKHEYTMP